jgi:hypothetical protein
VSNFFDTADLDRQAELDKEQSESGKFDPAPGDTLDAILTKAERFEGGQYDPTIVINLRNVGDEAVGGVEPGKIGYMFLPTVLRRKMLSAAPAVGTAFRLRFEGLTKPEGGGNEYKDWTILTESMSDQAKADRALWDRIDPGKPSASASASDNKEWSF